MQEESDANKHHKRIVENLSKLRRAITPVFSGNVGENSLNSVETMKRVFGVSQSKLEKNSEFFMNENARKLVYYAELVKMYSTN